MVISVFIFSLNRVETYDAETETRSRRQSLETETRPRHQCHQSETRPRRDFQNNVSRRSLETFKLWLYH